MLATRLLATALMVALLLGRAEALQYEPLADTDPKVLVISGEFDANESVSRFVEAVREVDAKTVTFNSSGGNVVAAMEIGRAIRAQGLNTLQLRQMECASACSLAFVGGKRRFAEPGSIGVHRASFAQRNSMSSEDAVASVQSLTASVISYLTEMGVDPKLLSIALSYDKSDMRYLSSSEMTELHVINFDMESATASSPPTAREADGSSVAVDADLEAVATDFIRGLVERHGVDAKAAIGQVIRTYAATVNYYGKTKTLTEVVEDKMRYFERWPERGYKIRDGSLFATCANSHCMITGRYDWVVRSVPRNKQARGVAKFSYTISLYPEPKVVAEDGQVVR